MKAYIIFLGALLAAYLLVVNFTTIFPICCDGEYYVDKNGYIHDNGCPYKSVPWFTIKYKKYDILIEADQEICGECLLYEEDKLRLLHKLNLKDLIKRYKRSGATEEYIKQVIMQYRVNI